MASPPLDNTHGRTTSGVTCHHRLWLAHTVQRRQLWYAINAFGQHTRSNYVGRRMPSSPLGSTNGRTTSDVASNHRLWNISHNRTALGVACHNRLKGAQTVKRRRACHVNIAFGQHTRSNDVGRCMTSPPFYCTHGQMTSGVACHHRLWAATTVE